MAKVKILVSGAHGRTGRSALAALSQTGLSVRAFIRHADQTDELLRSGADECVLGDMLDASSIAAAAAGCDKILHIGPPMFSHEVQVTESFLKAGAEAGIRHFIYYSVMHPLRREVRHHRLKLDAEERVIESGLPYTILQPCRYMQHLDPIWREVTGSRVHAMPFNVAVKFSVVDLLDLAAATAIVAADGDDHLYATYELAGPEQLSQTDMARIISEELGFDVTAQQIPLEALIETGRKKGLPDDRIEQMVTMNRHYDHYGFPGNANILTWLLGRKPTNFRTHVQRLKTASAA